ncbi:hypothetical protein AnigIFM63604_000912 [Aspergillus niger]|uniref:Major facilitator superfamily (MFS) profile domain-containing protein n=1 Tax=Aspergillus niger TaxID=5061 RepID=A0A9W6E6T3_ASPNG|nr:hypothetical protein AnigIFM63604_000912 [Aspergillus niger]
MATRAEESHDAITAVDPPAHGTGREKAADFLATVKEEERTFSPEEEKRVLRRIDLRILPLLLGAYFFQQLDKSTLSYVSIFGLVEDAHLHGQQYSWLGSILYLAQLVVQPLAALLLVKAPTGKVIGTAVLLWGSSLAIMAACTDFASLLGLRLTLGTFEAMIAPSCVAVTQMWWRRGEQTLRTAIWNAMNGVTFIVGSLFTYGLGHIYSDNLYSYQVSILSPPIPNIHVITLTIQIIFMFCGLLTVAYSTLVLIFMPDSPMEAKFLSEREKVIAVERLRANQMGIISREWRWDHVWETAYDVKTWLWFFLIVTISIPSGGISTFGNLIIKSFGYGSFETILFNIPFGAIQVIAILGGGWLATRFQRKGLVIALFAGISAIGTLLMIVVPREQKGVLLFGYYLVSCLAAITPLVYAWEAQNTAGDTKRKCTSAVVLIGMCAGNVGFFAPLPAPLYRPGLISNLILFVLVAVFAILANLYLIYLNRKHARRRTELGKSAQIVDESMLRKKAVEQGKVLEVEDVNVNVNVLGDNDKGFSDMTDLKNEDFIFVY